MESSLSMWKINCDCSYVVSLLSVQASSCSYLYERHAHVWHTNSQATPNWSFVAQSSYVPQLQSWPGVQAKNIKCKVMWAEKLSLNADFQHTSEFHQNQRLTILEMKRTLELVNANATTKSCYELTLPTVWSAVASCGTSFTLFLIAKSLNPARLEQQFNN